MYWVRRDGLHLFEEFRHHRLLRLVRWLCPFLALFGMAVGFAAWGADDPLASLVAELTQKNPGLAQAQATLRAAQAQVAQARALPNANFSFSEQANTGGPFDFNRQSGFFAYYTLTQPLLWPGKRELAGQIAQANAESTRTAYDALLLQLVTTLKLDYYGLGALRQQLAFTTEDLHRLASVKEIARGRYANNAAAYVDFLNAQVAESSLENDRFGLEKQIQSQVEQIDTLLARPLTEAVEVPDAKIDPALPRSDLPTLVALALDRNPTILGGQFQVQAAEEGVALARKGFYPDFQLSAGAYGDPALVHVQDSRMYSLGVAVTLPTWGFQKERAGLAGAEAQADAARDGDIQNRQQAELAVSNAYHALETAVRQVDFTKDRLLPQAQMAYRLALTAYSAAGGIAFSDLLTAESGLRSTELALTQSRGNALLAYVNLVSAIGCEPQ